MLGRQMEIGWAQKAAPVIVFIKKWSFKDRAFLVMGTVSINLQLCQKVSILLNYFNNMSQSGRMSNSLTTFVHTLNYSIQFLLSELVRSFNL